MKTFKLSQFHLQNGRLSAEASDLGLPVGQFPTFVTIRGKEDAVEYSLIHIDSFYHLYSSITPSPSPESRFVDLVIFND